MAYQHSHSDSHHHHHHHIPTGSSGSGGENGGGIEGRLWISICLNLVISIAQIIGGILSGSLALISDSIHNLSDTMSLGVSLGARKISTRKADKQMTFGYKRAEIIGAFINLVVLVVIGLFLIKEAVERFYSPTPVDGPMMFWVALIGLSANLISMLLLYRNSKENLNIKSAYVHLLWDTISSVGVIGGGIVIWLYDLYIVDTVLTIAIALYILYHSYYLLRETIDILMESTPSDIDIDEIERAIETVNDVQDVHHVHVWNLTEHLRLLECHVRIDESMIDKLELIKSSIKTLLAERFSINHSTLEFEMEPCKEREEEKLCV